MKYRHKKTNEILTIKKLFGSVALCESESEIILSPTLKVKERVCSIENLVKK